MLTNEKPKEPKKPTGPPVVEPKSEITPEFDAIRRRSDAEFVLGAVFDNLRKGVAAALTSLDGRRHLAAGKILRTRAVVNGKALELPRNLALTVDVKLTEDEPDKEPKGG